MNGLNGMERNESLLSEDIFTVFARLGFSKYEAKAYATLCACGMLKGGQLAKYSGVPQSKIYEVLGSLEGKNAVIVSRDRPALAESVPLKQIVSLKVKQYLKNVQRVLEYVESIQNTEVFKHLYHTRRIAMRSNGRFRMSFQAQL